MHHQDAEVRMFSSLLFMVTGELASPDSVCVAQCTWFILRCHVVYQSPSSYVLLVSCVYQGCPLYSSPSMGRREPWWRISHASYTYTSAATEVHAGWMHMLQGAEIE